MALLGGIAFDAPAALEAAALLANEGLRVALCTNPEAALPDQAEVVVLLVRGAAPVAEALAACETLLAAGAGPVLLITPAAFDDPAIGAAADALLRRLQAGFAPVLPGFPSRGRGTYLGHLFLGPALAPGEPNLPRRLAGQADAPVGLIPYRIVEEGAGAVRREMARLAEAGRRYAIADAVSDAHLRIVAEAATAQALLIGGAGLALGLAQAMRDAGRLPAAPAGDWPAPHGAWAVLAASSARPTLAQIGFARLHGPVLDLQSSADLAGAENWAVQHLSDEHPLVIAATPELAGDPELPAGMAALAGRLAAAGVGRLLVAGEALFAPMLRSAGGVIRIGPEVAEATPWCVAPDTGLQLAFKPGQAGGRDILLRAFLPE